MENLNTHSKLLPGCWYNARDCECTCKRNTYKLFDYTLSELNTSYVYTHKGCKCNEVVGLRERHQLSTGSKYTSKLDLDKHLKPLAKKLTPCSYDHIIKRATGGKKKLLLSAKESLEFNGVTAEDAKIKMFLKDDKYEVFDTSDPKTVAPRCIQYRSKRYCLPLASYMHPVEENLYKALDLSGTPIFAKSRNLTQRGEDLRTKYDYFTNPVILCLDHSKFDAHYLKDLIELEHRSHLRHFRRECRQQLRKLLNMQLRNKGATKHGTIFHTLYTRMSGDQNTGSGNSKGNYAMLAAFCEENGLVACYYVDGDDAVIIFEAKPGFKPDPGFFSQFGMETKIEAYTTEFQDMEFCQTRPVFDGKSWRMVRNPSRLLSRLNWSTKPVVNKAKYLKSVGLCEMALGVGLPVGQYVGNTLSTLYSDAKYDASNPLHYVASREFMRPTNVKLVEPTMAARLSYERAWGITVADQLRIEKTPICLPTLYEDVNYNEVFRVV